jgi:uncharacterized delta-60 repeat protein
LHGAAEHIRFLVYMSFAPVFFGRASRARLVQRVRESRRAGLFCLLGAAVFCALGQAFGQAGQQDPSFTSGALGGTIYAVAVEQVDEEQRILAGGDTDLLNGLFTDGVIDVYFENAFFGGESRIVYTIVPQILTNQADQDKTLVGGLFGETPTTSGNASAGLNQNILRLNSNGSYDTSFNPGYGADNFVTSIVTVPNGSMYVGGLFQNFDRIEHHHVVRLNVDGSIDNTFSSGLDINAAVLGMCNQLDPETGVPNGQIVVVGTFNNVDKDSTAKIARLNNDGSLDTTFHPVINTRVLTVVPQPDGKLIIGGSFTSVNNIPVQNIARLNKDGSLDTSFVASITTNPPLSPDPTAVYILNLLSDGRIYVGGNFYSADGTERRYLARLLSNGTLDTSFDPGTAVINSVQCLAVQPNSRLLVGETVSRKVNNVFPASLVRLFSNDPPVPQTVSIVASKPVAVEGGVDGKRATGQFKLVRSGPNGDQPLTVYVTTGGTAASGDFYRPLNIQPFSGDIYKVTIPANSDELTIGVRPTGHALPTSPETVTLALKPDQGGVVNYHVTAPTSATVDIENHH